MEIKVKCREHGELLDAYIEGDTIWVKPHSCSECYDPKVLKLRPKAWEIVNEIAKQAAGVRDEI